MHKSSLFVNLPGFSETLISRKMAPIGRVAHEEESIHGRANGHDPARGGSHTVAEAAKKHKVSDATIYAWRKHFGQMEAADVLIEA